MDFSSKPKDNESGNIMLNQLSRRLNDNTRRIRILEEKFDNVEGRLNIIEKRVMDDFQQTNRIFAETKEDTKTLGDRAANMTVDIKKINTHLSKMISRKEFIELQEYMRLISPVTTKYITRKEAEELIKEHISFK